MTTNPRRVYADDRMAVPAPVTLTPLPPEAVATLTSDPEALDMELDAMALTPEPDLQHMAANGADFAITALGWYEQIRALRPDLRPEQALGLAVVWLYG